MFAEKVITINSGLYPLQFHPPVTHICGRFFLKVSLEKFTTVINLYVLVEDCRISYIHRIIQWFRLEWTL